VHVQKIFRSKLEPCAQKCVFLGFDTHKKGYKCYNPTTRKFFTTMDVTFLEDEYFFQKPINPILGENRVELDWSNLCFLSPANELHTPSNFNQPVLANSEENNSRPNGFDTQPVLEVNDSSPTQVNQPDLVISVHSDPNPEQRNEPDVWTELDEEVIQSDIVPHGPRSPGDILEVSSSDISFKLPSRNNRGKPPKRYVPEDGTSKEIRYPIANYTTTENLSEPLKNFANQISSVTVPEKLEEALKDHNWVKAMKLEMEALEKNDTWKLVTLPEGKKTVGCKWVYTIKYNTKGKIERYKARLVAKGYTQTYGVDFQETFSPVAKLNSVRVLLSLAANLDWPLHQFDVKNAFLHGDLKEEIYMDIPPGYRYPEATRKVCKLEKALYGLKQSPRAWFGRFCQAMKSYGYTQSESDHTMFFKKNQGKITVLIIYVDDMIITGDDHVEIKELETRLSKEFEMKNLGGLKYFLGIEVSRSKEGIFLSQRKYILDLLTEVGMINCKPVDTPMVQNLKLDIEPNKRPENRERYQKLVGKLIYLSHTRPDITYAVSVVSRFMHCPSEEHMEAVMRILRYLKGAPGRGIYFRKYQHLEVVGYSDADWAGCAIDRKSTAGYFTFVGGNLVTWKSKKQNVVTLSSAEAEFRGMVKGICELLWLKKLLTELGFEPGTEMKLFCDNKAAIDISHNPVQHDRTKHIEVARHFIKENLDSKVISMPFVRSREQLADMLTKAVSSKVFNESLSKLGMADIYV
jgi:Reverse transcriptase (RNA-dependent DNA polymerase)